MAYCDGGGLRGVAQEVPRSWLWREASVNGW